MSSHEIKSITIGSEVYVIKPDEATQQASGLMSAEDKEKVDELTAITSAEISVMFSDYE